MNKLIGLFLISWFMVVAAVVGPLLFLGEMESLGGWRTILPWSFVTVGFAFFVLGLPAFLGLRRVLGGNVTARRSAWVGAIGGVMLIATVLFFGWGRATADVACLYCYAAFAIVGGVVGWGMARLPVSSLQAARWWWPLGRTFVAAPIVGFVSSLLGVALARREALGMLASSLIAGALIALSLVLGIAALVANRSIDDRAVRRRAWCGTSISGFLAVLWLLTHWIGGPQVRHLMLDRIKAPASSMDVSASAIFAPDAGPNVVPGEVPMPYHWCTVRAYGPGIVVASRGVMREMLNGEGQTDVFVWLFGLRWKACTLALWVS